jgi:hypothetical protein
LWPASLSANANSNTYGDGARSASYANRYRGVTDLDPDASAPANSRAANLDPDASTLANSRAADLDPDAPANRHRDACRAWQ